MSAVIVTDVSISDLGLSLILAEQELANAVRAVGRAKNRARCANEDLAAANERLFHAQRLIETLKLAVSQ